MGIYYFSNNSGGGDRLNAYTDQYIYYEQTLPAVRTAMDGTRPLIVVGAAFKVGGRGGSRSLYVTAENQGGGGASSSTAHSVGALDSATSTIGFGGMSKGFRNGGVCRLVLHSNGSFWYGRNTAGGGTLHTNPPDDAWPDSPVGWIEYDQVAVAPNTPAVDPSDDGKSASVIFTFTGDNGGAAVNGYRIQRATNSAFTTGVVNTNTTSGVNTITGLTPGTTYWWRVTARNSVSDAAGLLGGNWSPSRSALQPTISAAPTLNSAIAKSDASSVTVAWSAPTSSGGAAVLDYQLQAANNSTFTSPTQWTVASTSSLISYTQADQGQTRWYRVRARNSAGYGAWSNVRSANIPRSPTAPTLTSVTPSEDGTTAVVTFNTTGISDGGSPILGYRLQKATNSSFTQNLSTISVSPGSTTITNLSPSAQYWWRVTAYNAVSERNGTPGGDWSRTLSLAQPDPGVGRIRNGSNTDWIEMEGRIRNGSNTDWIELDGLIRNGANTDWVEIGN